MRLGGVVCLIVLKFMDWGLGIGDWGWVVCYGRGGEVFGDVLVGIRWV